MNLLLTRLVWITLPLSAGPAAADALQSWSTAPRITGEVLLWLVWAVVLLAVLVPRPLSLTAARAGAPFLLVAAVLAAWSGDPSTLAWIGAIVATFVATLLVTSSSFGRSCAQGDAYGDEERFPLKVPPALFLGLLPLAVLLVGAGIAAGPLLIADEHVVVGVIAVVVGYPLAALLLRSLHLLSRRWAVLVPAGFVLADPMTLTDPILFPREHILGLGPADPKQRPPTDAADLRLGGAFGSLALLLDDDVDLYRRARGGAENSPAHLVLFTPVQSAELLRLAGTRRINVRA